METTNDTSIEHDILADINAILAEPTEYDPICPGFGATWTRLFATGSAAAAAALAEVTKPTPAPPTRKRVPAVGCRVQRSDEQQRRKVAWLTTPPPPMNRQKRPPAATAAKIPAPANHPPSRPDGPITPPTEAVAPGVNPPAPPPPQPTPADVQPLRAEGSKPPPPIPVEVEPGHIIWVPYYHAHVSRQHKMRSGGKRWHIRFNHEGSVRTIREILPKP